MHWMWNSKPSQRDLTIGDDVAVGYAVSSTVLPSLQKKRHVTLGS